MISLAILFSPVKVLRKAMKKFKCLNIEPRREKTGFLHMSRVVRKPAFCICENKDADQLCDQRLCFRYTDSTIPLLPKSEISSL